MNGTILVLGATGKVGGVVVARLLEQAQPVRAATRDPAKASALPREVERVRFDLEQPATFGPALAGIDRVFLVARPGDDHADRVAQPLIEAMQQAGVEHVVDLSALGSERRPDFALRRVELALEASGMAFTHLRPGFFFQLFSSPPLLPIILRSGEIRVAAADAKLSFLDARDVGAVAAAALVSPIHRNRAYTLTGAQAVDHSEVAAALAAAAGRVLRYVPLSEEQARAELTQAGMPAAWVERILGFYRLVRAGVASLVTDDIASVLGRAPIDLAGFARDHAAVFASAAIAVERAG